MVETRLEIPVSRLTDKLSTFFLLFKFTKVELIVSPEEADTKHLRLCQVTLQARKEYLVNKGQREGVGALF